MNKTLLLLLFYLPIYSQTTFENSKVIFEPQSLSQSFIPIHIDQDELLDLAIVVRWGDNQRVVWKKNLGGGHFSDEKIICNSIYQPQFLAAGDIDNDGHDDLLITALRGKFYFFKSNGAGAFHKMLELKLSYSTKAFLKDINNDGFLDLIYYAYGDDSIGFYLNDGKGNFDKHIVVYDKLNKVVGIDVSDFDYDGDLDFVAVSNSPSRLVVFTNLGNNKFSNPQFLTYSGRQPQNVQLAEMDGDNLLDIVVSSSANGDVSIFANDGNGGFHSQSKIGTIEWANELCINDVDGDGDNDILIGQTYGSAAILYNQGSLNFSDPEFSIYVVPDYDNRYENNYGAWTIRSFDIDGDCDQDILTQEENLFLFINQQQDDCNGTDLKTKRRPELDFSFYPNPVLDIINIQVKNSSNYQVNIFSIKGSLLISEDNPKTISVDELVSSTYILQVKDKETGTTTSAQIIVIN